MKCAWGCGWEGTAAEYNEHYKICPKKVCPRCNSTNVFLVRTDEIECITCGYRWKKGEVPKAEEAPQVEEEKTWLIRNETLLETEGTVEEPLQTPVETSKEDVEKTSEETSKGVSEPSEK